MIDGADDDDRPVIQFPCENYPIRVMGEAGPAYQGFVLEVFERHAPGFDRTKVQVRPSRNGRFESVCVTITATGPAQLEAIFVALKQNTAVKMVL